MPALVVLSEFGEELLGNRQNMCAAVEELEAAPRLRDDKNAIRASVLPSEVTLRLIIGRDEETTGVDCSYCDEIHNWRSTRGIEGPGELIEYVTKGVTEDWHPNCAVSGLRI